MRALRNADQSVSALAPHPPRAFRSSYLGPPGTLNWPEQLLGRHYCTTLDAMGSFFLIIYRKSQPTRREDESDASDTIYSQETPLPKTVRSPALETTANQAVTSGKISMRRIWA